MIDLDRFYNRLAAWQGRPWDWRTANCCQFAADVLTAWGIEFAVPDCRRVSDAKAWLACRGARSLFDYLETVFGQALPPLTARRGWIVYAGGQGLRSSSVGVVDRDALFVTERGLVHEPLSECVAAFDPGNWCG